MAALTGQSHPHQAPGSSQYLLPSTSHPTGADARQLLDCAARLPWWSSEIKLGPSSKTRRDSIKVGIFRRHRTIGLEFLPGSFGSCRYRARVFPDPAVPHEPLHAFIVTCTCTGTGAHHVGMHMHQNLCLGLHCRWRVFVCVTVIGQILIGHLLCSRCCAGLWKCYSPSPLPVGGGQINTHMNGKLQTEM